MEGRMEGRIKTFCRGNHRFQAERMRGLIKVILIETQEFVEVKSTHPELALIGHGRYEVGDQGYATVEQAVDGAADLLAQQFKVRQEAENQERGRQEEMDDFFDL